MVRIRIHHSSYTRDETVVAPARAIVGIVRHRQLDVRVLLDGAVAVIRSISLQIRNEPGRIAYSSCDSVRI